MSAIIIPWPIAARPIPKQDTPAKPLEVVAMEIAREHGPDLGGKMLIQAGYRLLKQDGAP